MSLGSQKLFSCSVGKVLVVLGLVVGSYAAAEGPLVINEIMYHVKATPNKENPTAEFIELYHSGDQPVQIENWQFESGIRYTFPAKTMQPGEYLVLAADLEAFKERYPEVLNVVGPFRGGLSNGGETVKLIDADEKTVDKVSYADAGRWAQRLSIRTKGYDDWVWSAPHDGGGRSLSLVSPMANNAHGANWGPSETEGGTPGARNDNVIEKLSPMIVSVKHGPDIPRSSEPVTVTAQVEHPSAVTVTVYYRMDGEIDFLEAPNFKIPAMPDKTVVQFYVHVVDEQGLEADYPQLHRDEQGALTKRQALCLYQVDDEAKTRHERAPGERPMYRLITTADEIAMIRKMSKVSGRMSKLNHHFHATFIAVDGVETVVKYHVSARIRGNGSRQEFPPGLRVSFPSDDPWRGVTDINLNTQFTQSQSIGAAIHQLAGFPSARSTPVHVRMNGADWAKKGSPQFGCYVHNEVLDGSYVEAQFPGEEEGNLYRLVGNANLVNQGTNLSNYRFGYNKRNHGSEDDYSDVMHLIKTLAATKPSETYYDRVNEVMDVEQWAKYIALDALLCNTEGGMTSGRGDDVAMFRRKDGRFQLLPYDLDSIIGMGERTQNIGKSVFDYGSMSGLRQLFQDPKFLKLYTSKIIELTETVYRPEILNRLIEDQWKGWIPDSDIADVKEFLTRRIDIVLSQIKSSSMIASTLEKKGGFHKASSSKFALYGRFDRSSVEEILVGGERPKMFSQTGTWIMPPDRMTDLVRPGMNQIPIIMRDAVGNVVEQEVMRVWLDNGAVTRVSGSLPAGESIIWNASEGPYLLEDEVIVPATTSLVIEGGATVYGAANGKLVVEGVLKIAGTKEQRVTFAKDPSDSQSVGWAGIRLSGSLKGGATFSHADFLDLNGPIEVIDRDILCNELQVQWVGGHGLSGNNSNIVISDCVFRQRGEDGLALIDVKGGRLDLESSELERGAVIAETVYLFDNQFKQSVSPVIVMDQGFVDGNDFEIGSSAASPAIQSKGKTTLTRNRVFGLVDLMEASSNIVGNSKHSGSLPKRVLASADVVFLNQPPVKGPDAMVRFVVGGQGLASFRYQLDEGSWSEAVELNGKDRGAFALKVSAGSHQVRVLGRHVSGRSPSEEEAVVSRTFEVVPGLPSVVISEVLAVNKSAYLLDDQFDDFIELHNLGDQPFDLSGYQLSDDPEKPDVFEFPQGTMLAPNAYQVWTVSKDETDFALSGTGETVTLSDPKGKAVDQVTFGLQLADHSIARSEESDWGLAIPTPGAPNNNKACPPGESVRLKITEWLAVASVSAPDEFVELGNPSDHPVAIGGFTITDRIHNEKLWRPFPPLSFIGAQTRQVFLAGGDSKKGCDHLDFRLANEGEFIGLLDPKGRLVDYAVFGPQSTGTSQGRDNQGALAYGAPSPGRDWGDSTTGGDSEALVKGIRISEIHYHPSVEEKDEFIEVVNISDASLELDGMALSGAVEFEFKNETLAAGQRMVVVKDRKAFRKRYGKAIQMAGEFDGKLSNKGERVELATASGVTIVDFEYEDKWHNSTDGRGYSLELIDPTAARVSGKKSWRPSEEIGGSPGK